MTFLQPFILWALPLLLVPVIIHLVNRMRHRTQTWAAMRFLLSATQSSTSHAKLRQFLILALRVLAVVMLILFLGRPLAGGWIGWALAPKPDAVVILLDRSASMETRAPGQTISRREEALRQLAAAAKPFDASSHLVLIDSATRRPQEIADASALAGLPGTEPTDTAADLPGMLQAALKWLVDSRAGAAEIWIASDFQESNWTPQDGRWKSLVEQFTALPQKVRFRLLSFEPGDEPNTAVTLAELIRRGRPGQNGSLSYVLDLQRTTNGTGTIPVTVAMGGTRQQVEVPAEGAAMRWRSSLALDGGQTAGWGGFEIPTDANPRDNTAFFTHGAETPLHAVIVAEDRAAGRVAQFAAAFGGQPGELLRLEDAASLDLSKATLVCWQGPAPQGAVADRLSAFAKEGGVVLLLPSVEAGSGAFEGFAWGEIEAPTPPNVFRILRWDEEQGPLARTEERLSLPLASTSFARRRKLSGPAQVLAAFSDGAPFLIRKAVGKGEVYSCASLPRADWSGLADGTVLVPMMQRLLQAGARRAQSSTLADCGDLPPSLAQLSWVGVHPGAARNPQLHAGIFQAGNRFLAVNRPAAEDAPERLSAEQAMALFGALPVQALQQKATRADQLQGEIWRLFLFAMLLFLLAEGWLILPAVRASEPVLGRKPTTPAPAT